MPVDPVQSWPVVGAFAGQPLVRRHIHRKLMHAQPSAEA
jgi:hypothetical protein